eukprot:TRINITY_DN3318_c0_g1_i1.p1 TRINITY_DN3318_c0_g1~~TRINITY_DN3318_c0_g1_i1.p1  ORF type:complete len:490 (-),score=165.16 TRINITY_DN3318_c0_g1_i1:119-1543(-)
MGDRKVNLIKKWTDAGQGHVFQFADKLDEHELSAFLTQLESIDVEEMAHVYERAKHTLEHPPSASGHIKPLPKVFSDQTLSDEEKKTLTELGEKLSADGKVGVLLLAGGQGTRLGSSLPKGMYDIGLPSHKSLFQLQGERIKAQQTYLSKKFNKETEITWFIMTSPPTYQNTINYFKSNNFFGLKEQNVFFFNQAIIPCLTPEGKILLESASSVSCSPNGNGGMYQAMEKSGVLSELKKRGIQYLSQYCVDNVLVKVLDPVFIGLCASKGADVGVKVVQKAYPEEAVGVLCLKDDKPAVVEYSEIDKESIYKKNEAGKLVFSDSHICINLFSSDFLVEVANAKLDYHVAKKKIPHANPETGKTQPSTQINGWKMEKFIFDVFPYSKSIVAYDVDRNQEFAPLKNAPGSKTDSPETCQVLLSQLHKSWIINAGGLVEGEPEPGKGVEVSPLISFDGSGLEAHVKGKTFSLPLEIK